MAIVKIKISPNGQAITVIRKGEGDEAAGEVDGEAEKGGKRKLAEWMIALLARIKEKGSGATLVARVVGCEHGEHNWSYTPESKGWLVAAIGRCISVLDHIPDTVKRFLDEYVALAVTRFLAKAGSTTRTPVEVHGQTGGVS